MYDKTQTTAIFTAAQSGLQSSLQYLLQNNKDGITKTSIYNAMTGRITNAGNTNLLNNSTTAINSPFYQMINSEFSTLDKNNDGTLTADEANNIISNLSTGISREQLLLLRSQGSIDEELANKIISNFSKIDTNGDGKVSESEINAFCYGEEKQAMIDDKFNTMIKNMSIFYDTDTDSTDKETET